MARRDRHIRRLGEVVRKIYEKEQKKQINVPIPAHWASKGKDSRAEAYFEELTSQMNALSEHLKDEQRRIRKDYEEQMDKILKEWPITSKILILAGYTGVLLHRAGALSPEDALRIAYLGVGAGIGSVGALTVYRFVDRIRRSKDAERSIKGLAENAARRIIAQIPRDKITPGLLRDVHELLARHAEKGHAERIIADTFARVVLEDLELHPKYGKFV